MRILRIISLSFLWLSDRTAFFFYVTPYLFRYLMISPYCSQLGISTSFHGARPADRAYTIGTTFPTCA